MIGRPIRVWDRSLSRLIQSTRPPRAGAADVGMFFSFYARYDPVRLAPPGMTAAG
jgi:hypothetical protein